METQKMKTFFKILITISVISSCSIEKQLERAIPKDKHINTKALADTLSTYMKTHYLDKPYKLLYVKYKNDTANIRLRKNDWICNFTVDSNNNIITNVILVEVY